MKANSRDESIKPILSVISEYDATANMLIMNYLGLINSSRELVMAYTISFIISSCLEKTVL